MTNRDHTRSAPALSSAAGTSAAETSRDPWDYFLSLGWDDPREYAWEPWDWTPAMMRKRRLPQPRKPRRPSLTRLAAKAKALGIALTLEPDGGVTVRADSSASGEESTPSPYDEWMAKRGGDAN